MRPMTPSSAAPDDEGAKAVAAGGRFAHRRNPFMVERRRLNREEEEEEEPHFRGVNERPGTEEKYGKRTSYFQKKFSRGVVRTAFARGGGPG